MEQFRTDANVARTANFPRGRDRRDFYPAEAALINLERQQYKFLRETAKIST